MYDRIIVDLAKICMQNLESNLAKYRLWNFGNPIHSFLRFIIIFYLQGVVETLHKLYFFQLNNLPNFSLFI